ncbi:hypothetical protein [Brachyspira pulli]|uniref:hypothetical protein n=1 Tax=Brachyspira pulli TaxID=310721 RepID=UPI003007AD46
MRKIFYLCLFFIMILISCNMYVSDKVSILVFDEDSKGNRLTNETLEFILVKREYTNSFNKLTYISGTINNKYGNQIVTNLKEGVYIPDINDTNSAKNLDLKDYKMSINYNNKKIVFTDNDGEKYTLPLNNSENTWFYKLLQNNTNL